MPLQLPVERVAEIKSLYQSGVKITHISAKLGHTRGTILTTLRRSGVELRVRYPWNAERSKEYERTPKGYLMRSYRNMQSRVLGIQKREAKFYLGLPLLPREEFYHWSLNNSPFLALHAAWLASGRDRRLSPSVDRLDVFSGYTLDNMQWITHSENSGKLTRRWKGMVQ